MIPCGHSFCGACLLKLTWAAADRADDDGDDSSGDVSLAALSCPVCRATPTHPPVRNRAIDAAAAAVGGRRAAAAHFEAWHAVELCETFAAALEHAAEMEGFDAGDEQLRHERLFEGFGGGGGGRAGAGPSEEAGAPTAAADPPSRAASAGPPATAPPSPPSALGMPAPPPATGSPAAPAAAAAAAAAAPAPPLPVAAPPARNFFGLPAASAVPPATGVIFGARGLFGAPAFSSAAAPPASGAPGALVPRFVFQAPSPGTTPVPRFVFETPAAAAPAPAAAVDAGTSTDAPPVVFRAPAAASAAVAIDVAFSADGTPTVTLAPAGGRPALRAGAGDSPFATRPRATRRRRCAPPLTAAPTACGKSS